MSKPITKPEWNLCRNCIDAIKSRGEKVFVGNMICQDIDYDEEKDEWYQTYDEDEPILKCDWCGEVDAELYECI